MINLGTNTTGDPLPRASYIDEHPVREMKYNEKEGPACQRLVQPTELKSVLIGANVQNNSGDICQAAQQALITIVGNLKNDPAQLPDHEGSYLGSDPCTALDDATANKILNGKAIKERHDLHSCTWSSEYQTIGFGLTFGDKSDLKGTSTNVNGTEVHEERSNDPKNNICHHTWLNTATDSDAKEVLDTYYSPIGNVNRDQSCAHSLEAAKAIIANMSKK